MGNFAQQVHPLKDEVHLTIRRPGSGTIDAFSVSSLSPTFTLLDSDAA